MVFNKRTRTVLESVNVVVSAIESQPVEITLNWRGLHLKKDPVKVGDQNDAIEEDEEPHVK